MDLSPIVLTGRHVQLEPLREAHVEKLWQAGRDPAVWAITTSRMESADDMRRYVQAALELQRRGEAMPFVTMAREVNEIAGSTRFGSISVPNLRVEIGWTWLSPAWQRTALNTEAKLLMLTHAFETWRCRRVEFKTDARNTRSRAALARIGAVEEGTFRSHMVLPDGGRRDSVYFSVIDRDWPAVKERLTGLLAR